MEKDESKYKIKMNGLFEFSVVIRRDYGHRLGHSFVLGEDNNIKIFKSIEDAEYWIKCDKEKKEIKRKKNEWKDVKEID